MKYAVLHCIRAGQRVHRTARLIVDGAPEKTTASAVMTALEQAGKAVDFAEAGVPWGNHEIKNAKSLPAGTVGADDAPVITWDELNETRTVRRITLRLDPQDYARIHQAARRGDVSIQQWCVSALHKAAVAAENRK